MTEPKGTPCYQHDSYHPDCSDCYHTAEVAPSRSPAPGESVGHVHSPSDPHEAGKPCACEAGAEPSEPKVGYYCSICGVQPVSCEHWSKQLSGMGAEPSEREALTPEKFYMQYEAPGGRFRGAPLRENIFKFAAAFHRAARAAVPQHSEALAAAREIERECVDYEDGKIVFEVGRAAAIIEKCRAAAVPQAPRFNEIIDWLENEAEERMKHSLARRDAAELRNMTATELKEAKESAEHMFGRKLDLVSTKVKDNIRNCDIQGRIAEKLESEARQLSGWATLLLAAAVPAPGEKKIVITQPDEVISLLNDLGSAWSVLRNSQDFKDGKRGSLGQYWKSLDKLMGVVFETQVVLMKLRADSGATPKEG